MNEPLIARIYHVIDKSTEKVIKVGSTIQTLNRRFAATDYKTKYTNHFLREVKTIKSSELDWYEKGDPYCPFLWHLVAAEHLEIIKQGTLKDEKLANRVSPLDQKYFGFDGYIAGKFGGKIGGRKNVESGQLEKARTCLNAEKARKRLLEQGHMTWMRNLPQSKKAQSENGRIMGFILGPVIGLKNAKSGHMSKIGKLFGPINGRKSAESGRLAKISSAGGKVGGRKNVESGQIKALGLTQGKKNRDSGQMAAIGREQGRKHAESGHCARISESGNHKQFHVNRNRVNPRCSLCSEQSLIIAYA